MIVLVVEDNPVSARIIEAILHGAGHDVHVADGRAEARRQLGRRQDFQLVVCDIDLPDGSGLDLVAELRADPAHSALPVIMCTGADDPDSVRRAIEAGCTGDLLKPVNAARLLDRVAACAPAA